MNYCKKITPESTTYFKVNKYGLLIKLTTDEKSNVNFDEIDRVCPDSYTLVVEPL